MDPFNKFMQERRKEEYQMQHFEFCSSQFTHEGKEEVMSVIEEAATAFGRSVIEKYSPSDPDKIHSAVRKLIESYSAAAEEWGPSFQERMDSNFLCIPNNVLLDEDKPQESQYTREEVEKVDQEVQALERRVIAMKYMKAKLMTTLKVAKRTLMDRSKYEDSTQTTVLSLGPLVKAFDRIDKKRRKCHQDMDGCLIQGVSHQDVHKSATVEENEIPCLKKVKVPEINYKICQVLPEV